VSSWYLVVREVGEKGTVVSGSIRMITSRRDLSEFKGSAELGGGTGLFTRSFKEANIEITNAMQLRCKYVLVC